MLGVAPTRVKGEPSMNSPTVTDLIGVMEEKGYAVFDSARGHDLNLVVPGRFENVQPRFRWGVGLQTPG